MIQVAKIVEALRTQHQGLISGRMISEQCDHIGRCAIGALLHAAGMNAETIQAWGTDPGWSAVVHTLRGAYGLLEQEIHILLDYNDKCLGSDTTFSSSVDRLNKVCDFISTLAPEQGAPA